MLERRKRKLRSCCKIIFIITFSWCLIYFGFQHQNVDLDIGEHLDNAHNVRLKYNSKKPFYKYLNETWSDVKKSRLRMLDSESDGGDSSSSMNELKSHERNILKEFFNEKTTTAKKFILMTENRKNVKNAEATDGIIWRETVGPNGEYVDEYYQQINNDLGPQNPELQNYHERMEPESNQEVPKTLDELNRKHEEVEQLKEFMKPDAYKQAMDYIGKQAEELQADDDDGEPPLPDNPPDLENIEVALNKLNPDNQKVKNVQETSESRADVAFGPEPEVDQKLESSEDSEDVKKSSSKNSQKLKSSKTEESSKTRGLKPNQQSLSESSSSDKSQKPAENLQKSSTSEVETQAIMEVNQNDSDLDPTEIFPDNSSSSDQTQETIIQNLESDSEETSSSDSDLPGEFGAAVLLPKNIPEDIKKLVDEGWKNHQFNEYVSSIISPQRNLLDFRTDYCMSEKEDYAKILQSVSVIIVFYNEAWSTLIRSVFSIIDRSPPKLIKEIILVDDASEFTHLKEPLDEFMEQFEKVRIVRNTKREGLIHARNRGAMEAKAEVLLFLDSHIECTDGWLEPLLDRIALNSSTIAVPMINKINDTTFELVPREHPNYVTLGGFHWDLHFHWFYVQSEFYSNPYGPVNTPTISGGLFAISKKFFVKLGMFDPDLEIWGGENLELSFKAWMCGGKIEIAQCSHVGHVFRFKSPYQWENSTLTMRKNSMRVAKVWMDEYAVFYNYATGFDKVDYGDISERVKLRNKLKCNDFKWYLKTIYPERSIPDEGISYGEIKNLGFGGKMCLTGDAERQSTGVRLKGCHGKGRDQFWMYNGEIERDNYCLTYVDQKLITKHCRQNDNQLFTYNLDKQTLFLRSSYKCLEMTKNFKIILARCNGSEGQKWKLENLKEERIKKF